MTTIKNIGKIMLLTACMTFAACSEDDDKSASVSFPELQSIECEVDSCTQISFEALGNWKISSSALWCQFVVDDEMLQSYQGKAGKQELTLMVTADALELDKSSMANITLEIDGQEKVIYNVTRPSIGYGLKVMDVDQTITYGEENPLKLEYNKDVNFTVSANCTWTLDTVPEWLVAKNMVIDKNNSNNAVCGLPNEVILAQASVSPLYKYIPREGKMVFVDDESKLKVTVPVVFDGMPADEIDFSLAPNQRYNWSFSADSWTVSTGSDMGTSTTEDTPKIIEVWAKDQDYECVRLVRNSYGYTEVSMWDQWFYVNKFANDAKISITVDPNSGEARSGCVMVFPRAVFDEIGERYDDYLYTEDWMDIKPQYTKYVAFDFTQEAPAGSGTGFDIKNMGWLDIPSNYLMNMADQMGESELIEMFGTSNVWMLATEEPYSSLMITPKGLGVDYFETTTIFNGVDTKFPNVEFEPMGDCIMLYNLDVAASGEMKITFTSGYTGEVLAVLIVATYF